MLAAYGVDVLDPKVSTRRVHVLLERLPPHVRRAGEDWSTEAELLAGLIDHVAQLTYVTLQANGAKGATRPQPVPRPRRRSPLAVEPRPAARAAGQPDAPGKAATWFDAALLLGKIPGVVTDG